MGEFLVTNVKIQPKSNIWPTKFLTQAKTVVGFVDHKLCIVKLCTTYLTVVETTLESPSIFFHHEPPLQP